MKNTREIPILFGTPMVEAILAGRKHMTRRIIRDAPLLGSGQTIARVVRHPVNAPALFAFEPRSIYGNYLDEILPPYPIDACLWVREAWMTSDDLDQTKPADMLPQPVWYKARGGHDLVEPPGVRGRLRPGIHMPRWASRLTLTVTDVRAERVQSITPPDAIREGVSGLGGAAGSPGWYHWAEDTEQGRFKSPEKAFEMLWRNINGDESWESNPYVWVISFETRKGNIDERP